MKRKTLLSWSSGKDSAWALHVLRQMPDIDVVGLFCTINKHFNRVAMHAVRVELLQRQAQSAGLPLHLIEIPHPCSNEDYQHVMGQFVAEAQLKNIECFAFGDLFLEDIRHYREERLQGSGITAIFPLWGIPTDQLAHTMFENGLKAKITCIDPKQLDSSFAGRDYNPAFLADLPAQVDPCGERGEFHSFAYDGPMFSQAIPLSVDEIIERDGFVFADLLIAQS